MKTHPAQTNPKTRYGLTDAELVTAKAQAELLIASLTAEQVNGFPEKCTFEELFPHYPQTRGVRFAFADLCQALQPVASKAVTPLPIEIRFMSLTGKFRCLRTQRFASIAHALAAVQEHAAGFKNFKVRGDEEDDYYGLAEFRITATTPGGRHGRNVAFGTDYTADILGSLES